MPAVTFKIDSAPTDRDAGEPEAVVVEVPAGATVHEAACVLSRGQGSASGVPLAAPCGGRGRCGRCVVEFARDPPPPTEIERRRLSEGELDEGKRLACQARVERDVEVRIPASSRAAFTEMLEDGECAAFPLEPAVRVRDLKLEPPSLDDPKADLVRLGEALGLDRLEGEIEACRALPSVLRAHGFSARVVVRGSTLLEVRPPDARSRAFGAAFDIGTTTVAGSLVDLETGDRAALASRTNPQHALGDDVVSRMDYAARGGECLAELQGRIVGCLNELVEELAREAGASVDDVLDVVVAGNNGMTHLFLGLPPEAMATVPFAPVVTGPVEAPARSIGLRAAKHARVWTAPAVSAYVGGDIVAGLVAVGLGGFERETLYIDIGTNGEVVAGSRGRALSAATAAGPAFEGA
ncbi:MAG: ASKHA domain-containing protein, partial [Planctomycetota bacterium]